MDTPDTTLKLRNRIYHLHYTEKGIRRRISLHTDNEQVARELQRQFESALARGANNPLPTRTPLVRAVSEFVDYMRSHQTAKGFSCNVSYLRTMFGPICPALERGRRSPKKLRVETDARTRPPRIEAKYLEDITPRMISAFIRERVRLHGLRPKTANRYREVLQHFFNWAIEEGDVRLPGDENPAERVRRYRQSDPEIRFLQKNEIAQQLDALEPHPQLQAMVALYIYAGLRREEALWLRAEDVDRAQSVNGILRIESKSDGDVFWTPKTKKRRIVPISRALREYLDAYEPPATAGRWYFPSPEGHRWDPDNFSRALRQANRALGLDWGCRDYRRTFGSQLVMKGESLYKISEIMGNSPEICRRYYAKLLPESLMAAVEFEVDAPRAPAGTPIAGRPHLRLIVNENR